MGKHLSLTLIIILVFISMLVGCSSSTFTQKVTVTQTQTKTQTVTDTNKPVITFLSSGNKVTTTFVCDKPWILQYSTNYTGTITIAIMPFYNLLIVNNGEVIEGEVYQIEMGEYYTGYPLHFEVRTGTGWEGEWTILLIES